MIFFGGRKTLDARKAFPLLLVDSEGTGSFGFELEVCHVTNWFKVTNTGLFLQWTLCKQWMVKARAYRLSSRHRAQAVKRRLRPSLSDTRGGSTENCGRASLLSAGINYLSFQMS